MATETEKPQGNYSGGLEGVRSKGRSAAQTWEKNGGRVNDQLLWGDAHTEHAAAPLRSAAPGEISGIYKIKNREKIADPALFEGDGADGWIVDAQGLHKGGSRRAVDGIRPLTSFRRLAVRTREVAGATLRMGGTLPQSGGERIEGIAKQGEARGEAAEKRKASALRGPFLKLPRC